MNRLVLCVALLFSGLFACRSPEVMLTPGEQYERLGDQAYRQQNFDDAVRNYQQAVQAGSQKVGLYNNLANAHFMGGRYNVAKQNYLKALELDPGYLLSLNNLVLTLYRNGERGQAYKLLVQAQTTYPGVSFFHTTYGVFRFWEGDREASLLAFKEAIRNNLDSPVALNNLGTLYLEDASLSEDPLPYLKRAIQKDPDNKLFSDSLGWYHFRKGMFAEATIEIGRAFAFDPRNLEVRVHYATVLEWIGKEKEALKQWEAILELTDDNRIRQMAREHFWEIRGRGIGPENPG